MHIALHIGAHCTDEDFLLKTLLVNRENLAQSGVVVPEPGRYRPVVRETLHILKDAAPTPEMQETILDALLDEDDARRVVLSHDSFLCVPGMALGDGALYPMVGKKAPRLRTLFAHSEVSFHIALRDPATFIPSVFERAQETEFANFISDVDPMTLRWSSVISRLRQAVPEAPVTVWCNEDTPLIWPEVLRAVAGLDASAKLKAEHEFLRNVMSRNGVQRLQVYLDQHPPANIAQRRRVVSAFLDKFAQDDALEQEIDLPGWSAAYVDTLSQLYDEDVAQIAAMEGVTFIAP